MLVHVCSGTSTRLESPCWAPSNCNAFFRSCQTIIREIVVSFVPLSEPCNRRTHPGGAYTASNCANTVLRTVKRASSRGRRRWIAPMSTESSSNIRRFQRNSSNGAIMEDISTTRKGVHLAVRSPQEGIKVQGRKPQGEAKARTTQDLALLCSSSPSSICRLRVILLDHHCLHRVGPRRLGLHLVLQP